MIGGAYLGQLATKDMPELSHWCRETMRARVIALDAPCRWSKDGHSRPAERAKVQAELEYDRYRIFLDSQPRAVDAAFEQATKDLKKLPKPKKPKPPEK